MLSLQRPNKILFLFVVLSANMMLLSSSSWFYVWAFMEANTLSFIPFMINSWSSKETSSVVTYFVIQALSSVAFLLAALFSYMMNHLSMLTLVYMTMLTKMGAAPCHFWLPSVMNMLKWLPILILSTWQKLGPLIIISTLSLNSKLVMASVSLNALIGSLGGLNQTQMRKLIAFSSISHMGWILASTSISPTSSLVYLLIYSSILASMLTFLKASSKYLTNYSNNIKSWPPSINTFTMLSFLSMAGLPPLSGFLLKIMVIILMLPKTIIILLIMSSMISSYYYISLYLNSTLSNFSPSTTSSYSMPMSTVTPLLMLPPLLMIL